MHLSAAANEFPLYEGRAEDPPSGYKFQEWIRLYQRHLENLGCTRGVIVHSIFYGTDNSVTVAALREMGAGFRGIGLLPDQASEADLDQFVAWNIAGVRLNYVHGGVLSWKGAKAMAPKMADAGSLMDAFYRVVSDKKTRDQILIENPKKLYGFVD